MDNLNPGPQPPAAPQTQPSPVPPPPRAPEVKIRTMESDIKSVEQSGGGVPEPETINLEEMGTASPEPALPPPPEKVLPKIEPREAAPAPLDLSEPAAPRKVRKWLVFVLVGSIFLSLGVAAYVYLASFYMVGPAAPATQPATGPQPLPITAPVIPAGKHSIFGLREQQIAGIEISDYSVINILTALQNEAVLMSADQPFKEVNVAVGGAPAVFSSFLAVLLPELENTPTLTALKTNFDDNFAGFLIYQEGQVWPGYVVRKKSGVNQVTIDKLADIEKSSVSNIYLTLPKGQPDFSTGPVGDKYTSRYASFNNKPASFNYGIFGDYLIISTTYLGLQVAVEMLGL